MQQPPHVLVDRLLVVAVAGAHVGEVAHHLGRVARQALDVDHADRRTAGRCRGSPPGRPCVLRGRCAPRSPSAAPRRRHSRQGWTPRGSWRTSPAEHVAAAATSRPWAAATLRAQRRRSRRAALAGHDGQRWPVRASTVIATLDTVVGGSCLRSDSRARRAQGVRAASGSGAPAAWRRPTVPRIASSPGWPPSSGAGDCASAKRGGRAAAVASASASSGQHHGRISS